MKKTIIYYFILFSLVIHAQTKLSTVIYFDSGKSDLNSAAISVLDTFYAQLKGKENYKIIIKAHSDSIGSWQSNQLVSKRRADEVYFRLITLGIPSRIMQRESYSFKNPTANNNTEDGRQKNRRVEIEVEFYNQKRDTNIFLKNVYKKECLNLDTTTTQIYTIFSDKEQIINCKNGTVLTFKPNSFRIKDSYEDVKGKVTIHIREYYDMSAMVLANLYTYTNLGLLETGGMFFIEVFSEGKLCELKPGVTFGVQFNDNNILDEDMQLFYGLDNTGQVVWNQSDSPREFFTCFQIPDSNSCYISATSKYEGGTDAFYNFINKNLVYSREWIDDSIVGKRYTIFFKIDRFGNVFGIDTRELPLTQSRLSNSINNILSSKGLLFFPSKFWHLPCHSKDIDCLKRFYKSKRHNSKIGITLVPLRVKILQDKSVELYPLLFLSSSLDITYEYFDEEYIKNSIKQNYKYINSHWDVIIFQSSSLGWLNYDKIINSPLDKLSYLIDLNNRMGVDAKLIFKNIKCIVDFEADGNFYKSRFPLIAGEPAILILTYQDAKGLYYLSTKEIVVSNKIEKDFQFRLVSPELMTKEILKVIPK